jgi:hypothetical protein
MFIRLFREVVFLCGLYRGWQKEAENSKFRKGRINPIYLP